MGTVEFTGLEMMRRIALVQFCRAANATGQRAASPGVLPVRSSRALRLLDCPYASARGLRTLAQASTRVATIEALVLKRSSRVMPGLRGTPAGIKTMLRGEGGIGQGVSRFMVIPLL